MALRHSLVSLVRELSQRAGFFIVRSNKFGIDALMDARRLACYRKLPIDCIFDVGANTGETAIRLLNAFPHTPVVSFEPHPKTFEILNRTIGSQVNFTAVNLALSSTEGTRDFFEYALPQINSLEPNAPFAVRFAEQPRRMSVTATTLDVFCNSRNIERIGLLKIDTEGHDLEVLRGAEQMLSRRGISFIYLEFNDLRAGKNAIGGALLPIEAYLHQFGYRFFASYMDYAVMEGDLFTVSNALFILNRG